MTEAAANALISHAWIIRPNKLSVSVLLWRPQSHIPTFLSNSKEVLSSPWWQCRFPSFSSASRGRCWCYLILVSLCVFYAVNRNTRFSWCHLHCDIFIYNYNTNQRAPFTYCSRPCIPTYLFILQELGMDPKFFYKFTSCSYKLIELFLTRTNKCKVYFENKMTVSMLHFLYASPLMFDTLCLITWSADYHVTRLPISVLCL